MMIDFDYVSSYHEMLILGELVWLKVFFFDLICPKKRRSFYHRQYRSYRQNLPVVYPCQGDIFFDCILADNDRQEVIPVYPL